MMIEKIEASETRQFKAVFPNTLNANETLFGGQVMMWMDEVAYITATRFTHQKMYTAYTDKIKFLKPIFQNSFVEIVGRVETASIAKVKVKVEVFAEEMYREERYKVVESIFTFASLDDNKQVQKIIL